MSVIEYWKRVLPFGRYKGAKETFDFLGFTFFNTTTRTGKYRVGGQKQCKEDESEETGSESMVKRQADKTNR